MSDYVKNLPRTLTAIVLAGERPGGDALAARFRVDAKALVPVAGAPMGDRVVATLAAHPALETIRIFADRVRLPSLGGIPTVQSEGTIAATVEPLIANAGAPLLITTADHPLLDAAMIEAFVAGAIGHDLAIGLVERGTLLNAYPASHRTWLRFRGGAYSGANLFWLASPKVLPLVAVWRSVEQRRKRGRALIAAFGPWLLFGVALRLLTLDRALSIVGRRFGLSIAAVVLTQPEACIDVDTAEDRDLAEAILLARAP